MRAISSTEAVSVRTGRSPLRATPQPATPAAITPASPKSSITAPSLVEHPLLGLQRLGEHQRLTVRVGRHGDDPVVLVPPAAMVRMLVSVRAVGDLELGPAELQQRARCRRCSARRSEQMKTIRTSAAPNAQDGSS